MDSINFKFQRIQIDPQDYDDELLAEYTHELILQSYINNQYFHFENNEYYLNISRLEYSLQESCKCPIFVCGCGDEGCAGIVNTPKIIVLDSVIVWEIYEPKEFNFTFDRIQILTAIKDLKDSMLQYCSLEEWQKTMYLGIEDADYFLRKSPIHIYKEIK